ncbi:F0F1 ATP synthase subunit delta [Mobilicoccus caccae]|uniref:ATP synthase subunit delta n=1 Tax=Mobilicoccus caccae TaxID=1859295 RepID=A0ABQ6ILT7_9MICO|nr:F0F1 ATP synthase subunit delta [Mobilicoccus caccae]GMA38711.1 ATP synthase subunit delta [Mobilicoccus caccae]
MEGPSRGSWVAADEVLAEVLPDVDARNLAGELFAIGEAVDGNAKLRRSLADPSRDAGPKRAMVRTLFDSRVSPQAVRVLETVASGRWRTDRDMVDALERLGVDAVLAAAEKDGVLDQVEDELFRFERLVAADHELSTAISRREVDPQRRAQLVVDLLAGRALPDTVWLAQRPVLHPRGRKYSAAIWAQLKIAAKRREQITAIVTSAVELDAGQRDRLAAGLTKLYGRNVFVTVVVDPDVLGGLRVRIGDEVIDGTVRRRLEDVRRSMGTA